MAILEKNHISSTLKTIRNSWKSLHETSVFQDSLIRASLYTFSWHIIPKIHLKSEAEAVYKDSITIICSKLSSQLSTSPLNGCQRKSSRLLPSSSHLQQLGVSTWKQALSEAATPYRGCISRLRVNACPLLLPASSRWEKQSQSEVILSWYKQSPNKAVFLLSTTHVLDQSSFLHTLVPSFSSRYINQINLVSCF